MKLKTFPNPHPNTLNQSVNFIKINLIKKKKENIFLAKFACRRFNSIKNKLRPIVTKNMKIPKTFL